MMQRLTHMLLAMCMLAGLAGIETSAAAQVDDILDLADIPLTVQALPEAGYQVLAGGYLAQDDIGRLIADPRHLDADHVLQQIDDIGITRAYVLDLVLPEDRAWQNSPVLAIVQTSVYLLEDENSSDDLVEILQNYANTAFVTDLDPAVNGAYTISMVGEGGDQLRTIATDGRVVIEIVSMDATGTPNETEHMLIVEATVERLSREREEGQIGLSSMALTLLPGERTANFGHTQQTGVHGIYRFRDANIQPAIGELADEDQAIAPGIRSLFVAGEARGMGGGTGLVSVWLGQFDSESSATSFFDVLVSGVPGGVLVDPYFTIAADESWTEQGVLGVYRVTGTHDGQNYSGNVEVRQQGDVVVAIGYRSVGASLSSINITGRTMDHQLDCLDVYQVCAPFDLSAEMPPPQATPVAAGSAPGSTEFGWSLPELGPEWIIDEQFTEAGYDRIGLRNGLSIFEIESVINHHGEPVQCVLDELHLLQEFEDHSVITVWEDAVGNTEGGNTESQAWVVYRVEPLADERADQEYVIRIDCFSLLPGSANLVIKQIAPVDFWEEEQSKGTFLRDSIVIPELSGVHGKLAVSAHDRRTTMILTHETDQAA